MIFSQRIENGRGKFISDFGKGNMSTLPGVVQICCGQYASSDLPRTIAQVKDFAPFNGVYFLDARVVLRGARHA